MGLNRIAVNYIILESGDRSSWPHAHSEQEEFLFILKGHGQVWVDGNLYDVSEGDSIAFPPGTGITHCLINNSENQLRLIVVGEQHVKSDKAFYAKHHKRNEEFKTMGVFWDNHPVHEMGQHDSWPDKKRPK
ncbi:MAG: cupin domain-containing protein [Proteobacteria bacterium]|nr:cupin domain-containing protein [Pseudomonadota bacterium]